MAWVWQKQVRCIVYNNSNIIIFFHLPHFNPWKSEFTSYWFLLIFPASKYLISPEHIFLIHDELDKPLGKFGIKHGGSARWIKTFHPIFFVLITFFFFFSLNMYIELNGDWSIFLSFQGSQWCEIMCGLPSYWCKLANIF